MGRRMIAFLLLLLLSGCAPRSAPAAPPPQELPAAEAPEDLTLPVAAALPLPVTEESLRAWYEDLGNFYRRVTDIRKDGGVWLVRSVTLPETETEHGIRFDLVNPESGSCWPMLEGAYSMDEVFYLGDHYFLLKTTDDFYGTPVEIQVSLPREAANGGWPRTEDLFSVAEVEQHPATLELASHLPLTLGHADAAQPLEAICTGPDTLELLFHTDHDARIPAVELTYDEDGHTLTLLCRSTELRCEAPAGNLYVNSIEAAQQGEDTLISCALHERAWAIQTEIRFLPGYDWAMGVLRITFWPFMG